jgi:hypothetical protein
MGLLDKIFRVSELEKIKKNFDFLTEDFDFQIIKSEINKNFKADNFIVYRNDNSKLQVEICGDESWFHVEIRRLINGLPAKYSDKENCIGFESLALLESNNQYDHFYYFVGGQTGLKGVMENTAKLFKRHSVFFTTDSWIDTRLIEKLRDKDFQKTFGKIPDKSNLTFFGRIKEAVLPYLIDKGFKISLDSEELSPFDNNSLTKKVIFEKGKTVIKIYQLDWRDAYDIYCIAKNDNIIFEIDTNELGLDKAMEIANTKIREII